MYLECEIGCISIRHTVGKIVYMLCIMEVGFTNLQQHGNLADRKKKTKVEGKTGFKQAATGNNMASKKVIDCFFLFKALLST